MLLPMDCPHGVRFRTEKNPFSGIFAAKVFAADTANRTLAALNNKGAFGLVH